jgi:hypothetical protein
MIRKYYLTVEKILRDYYIEIENNLKKELGLVKKNQKQETLPKGGHIYIIKAQNTTEKDMFKIGNTIDLKIELKAIMLEMQITMRYYL